MKIDVVDLNGKKYEKIITYGRFIMKYNYFLFINIFFIYIMSIKTIHYSIIEEIRKFRSLDMLLTNVSR